MEKYSHLRVHRPRIVIKGFLLSSDFPLAWPGFRGLRPSERLFLWAAGHVSTTSRSFYPQAGADPGMLGSAIFRRDLGEIKRSEVRGPKSQEQ